MLTMHPFTDDKLHEECGIFAVHDHPQASALTAFGLHALQHRGQEATGIVSYDGHEFYSHRGLGKVGDNFSSPEVVAKLKGNLAIGHNRYATTGETTLRNVQPLYADFEFGGFALAHNGNLTNAYTIRQTLVERGALFQSTTDTEVIFHLMATARDNDLAGRLIAALKQVEGAYSIVALAGGQIIGVRDPYGMRPLSLGKIDGAYVLSSETCALDITGAEFIRDIEPGELVVIDGNGIKSFKPFANAPHRFCVFEYIYFARPDSVLEGRSVYEARRKIGIELAREAPALADVIVPVPDSGVPAAIGYAAESGLPFELGIIRSHYVGRTFIQPTDRIRSLGVKMKHNANRDVVEGKRVVLVDDSIIRGTTSRKIVDIVRSAGAKEVHMRISSPPTAFSCYYGIDTPEQSHLLAHTHSLAEMAREIGVDSLAFISFDGLYRAMGEARRDPVSRSFCDACFTGDYHIPLTDLIERDRLNAEAKEAVLMAADD